jgi:hypothetical protein
VKKTLAVSVLSVVASVCAAQEVKPAFPEEHITSGFISGATAPTLLYGWVSPITWKDEIGADGHYRAVFEDSENKWRCSVVSTTPNVSSTKGAITIVCAAPHEVQKEDK